MKDFNEISFTNMVKFMTKTTGHETLKMAEVCSIIDNIMNLIDFFVSNSCSKKAYKKFKNDMMKYSFYCNVILSELGIEKDIDSLYLFDDDFIKEVEKSELQLPFYIF